MNISRKTQYIVYNGIATTSVHNFKPIALFMDVQRPNNQVKAMTSLSETDFLAFLIVVRQNKRHCWNPETKLDKISMF